MLKHSLLVILVGALYFGDAHAAPKTVQPSCMTTSCHAEFSRNPFKHGPVKAKGCRVCHVAGNSAGLKLPKDHPGIKPIIAKDLNATCLVCHDDFGEKLKESPVIHPAIEKKGCVGCHNPHGSNYKYNLKEKAAPTLCLTCHEDMKTKIADAKVHHAPITSEASCQTCHEVHASTQKKLLKKPVNELCINCHSKEQKSDEGRIIRPVGKEVTTLPFIHKPVTTKCSNCHNPHGSKNVHLLDLVVNEEFYSTFDVTKNTLCMDCHEPALVTSAETTADTDFRNGSMNLHNFHVIKRGSKGMSCLVCHAVHASNQPKMIKDWTNFNGVQLPLIYKKTENGGGCMTACHGLKNYDRIKEEKNASGR